VPPALNPKHTLYFTAQYVDQWQQTRMVYPSDTSCSHVNILTAVIDSETLDALDREGVRYMPKIHLDRAVLEVKPFGDEGEESDWQNQLVIWTMDAVEEGVRLALL
jgi:hypothetical protein